MIASCHTREGLGVFTILAYDPLRELADAKGGLQIFTTKVKPYKIIMQPFALIQLSKLT